MDLPASFPVRDYHQDLHLMKEAVRHAPEGAYEDQKTFLRAFDRGLEDLCAAWRTAGLRAPEGDLLRTLEAVLYGCARESNPLNPTFPGGEAVGRALADPDRAVEVARLVCGGTPARDHPLPVLYHYRLEDRHASTLGMVRVILEGDEAQAERMLRLRIAQDFSEPETLRLRFVSRRELCLYQTTTTVDSPGHVAREVVLVGILDDTTIWHDRASGGFSLGDHVWFDDARELFDCFRKPLRTDGLPDRTMERLEEIVRAIPAALRAPCLPPPGQTPP